MKITFLISLFIIFYTYIGYGLLLFLLVKINALIHKKGTKVHSSLEQDYPPVTLIIAAFNEEKIIRAKIENCESLTYPHERIKVFWVTDGSTDHTKDILENYNFQSGIESQVFHSRERRGKLAAIHRVMHYVETEFVIFSDANSMVNKDAFQQIVRHYADPRVGAVCGEKQIRTAKSNESTVEGESIYWKIESKLKNWDSELNTVVGAAGELFSIRTDLYEKVPPDTIIEDFHISMKIAQKGYKVKYEPNAVAQETGSLNSKEELKRKIRIAAGGFQAIGRFLPLLNIFQYGMLSFQYISHRVLRWTLGPLLLPILFFSNLQIASWNGSVYSILLYGQIGFYLLAIIGWLIRNLKVHFRLISIAYHFCLMNFAIYRGFSRFFFGTQAVAWEKSKRIE